MPILRNFDIHLPPGGAERLKHMIVRKACVTLTVRLRIDPLPPSLFDDVLVRGDMSRVLMFAELNEEARDILLVIRAPEPNKTRRSRRQHRMDAITIPYPFTIAIDEENGRIVIEGLPDRRLFH